MHEKWLVSFAVASNQSMGKNRGGGRGGMVFAFNTFSVLELETVCKSRSWFIVHDKFNSSTPDAGKAWF